MAKNSNPNSLANLVPPWTKGDPRAVEAQKRSRESPKLKETFTIRKAIREALKMKRGGKTVKELIFGKALIEKARDGDIKAMEFIADQIGETPEIYKMEDEAIEGGKVIGEGGKTIAKIHAFLSWQKVRGNLCFLYGTTRSGKTYAVCQWLCHQLATGGITGQILIAGQTVPFLRNGCAAYLQTIAPQYGLEVQDNGMRVRGEHGIIVLQSFEKPERVLSAQWSAVFINEGNVIPEAIIDGLRIRCAGLLFTDFNPSCAEWWGKSLMAAENSLFCTFKDNPYLGEQQLAAIEAIKERGENAPLGSYANWYYQVYYLGRFTKMGGGVFTNVIASTQAEWDAVELPTFWGIDFGDTTDPNALVAVKVDKEGRAVHVLCRYYQTGTDDMSMTEVLKQNGVGNLIFETATGGNTRAKNFRALGFTGNLYPCQKEQVAQSVFNLSTWRIVCHDDVTAGEFRGYRLDGGKFRGSDHCIDAVRYVTGLVFNNKIMA